MREGVFPVNNEYKYRKNMRCLDKWMHNREKGKNIAEYLWTCHVNAIGIYGYGILGKHLVWELQEKNYPISWIMDKDSWGDERYCDIVRPDDADSVEKVGLIVITALAAVEEVESFLMKQSIMPVRIISIEELIEAIHVWGNQG